MGGKLLQNVRREINTFKKSIFAKGSFAQNFAFTFSGNAIGIVSQIIFAPILSRIYGPEAYGLFSLFNAIATNLSIIATFRLEGALILPKTEKEFERLLKTVVFIPAVLSLLIFSITLVAKDEIESIFKIKNIGNLMYGLGPYVFLICFTQITANWVVRRKAFKDAVMYGTPIGIGARVFNVIYGWFTKGATHGLILTDVITRILSIIMRFRYILKFNPSFFFKNASWKVIKYTVSKYRQFPLYDLPGTWINTFSTQLPIFMLTFSFGTNPVGQFGFAASLLEIPMRLLGNAVSPVFLQKASQTFHEKPEDLGRITEELYKKLLYLGVFPFAVLTVFGDLIFKWVFGPQWVQAGIFTGYLGFFYLFRLISSPLSSIFVISAKQSNLLIFQIVLFAGRVLSLYIGFFMLNNVLSGVLLFGLFNTIAYFVLSVWILQFVKAPVLKLTIRTILIAGLSFLMVCLLRKILL
jgi:O-antigen/teichoic acid export membrane protein